MKNNHWLEEMGTVLQESLDYSKMNSEEMSERSRSQLQTVKKERSYGFIKENNTVEQTEEGLSLQLKNSIGTHSTISKFHDDKNEFHKKLRKDGIEPMVILPKRLWTSFCKQFDLYEFNHLDNSGRTSALFNPDRCYDKKSGHRTPSVASDNRLFFSVIGLCLVLGFLIVLGIDNHQSIHNKVPIFGFIILTPIFSCIIAMVGSLFVGGIDYDTILIKIENMVQKKRYLSASKTDLYKMLWPSGQDSFADLDTDKANILKVRLQFKNAPDSVLDIVNKLKSLKDEDSDQKYSINISAHEDSFEIDKKGLASAIDILEAKKLELIAGRLEAAKQADPIVYIQSKEIGSYENDDCLVAILCQYGDFPKEKEAIEWARHNNFFSTVN